MPVFLVIGSGTGSGSARWIDRQVHRRPRQAGSRWCCCVRRPDFPGCHRRHRRLSGPSCRPGGGNNSAHRYRHRPGPAVAARARDIANRRDSRRPDRNKARHCGHSHRPDAAVRPGNHRGQTRRWRSGAIAPIVIVALAALRLIQFHFLPIDLIFPIEARLRRPEPRILRGGLRRRRNGRCRDGGGDRQDGQTTKAHRSYPFIPRQPGRRAIRLRKDMVPERDPCHPFVTKLSITRLHPACSKSISSLLPSIAAIAP